MANVYNFIRQTTKMYQYSNLENLLRLQKCLQGDARQVVEAKLVYPDNVPMIMDELHFRFGRSDMFVK